jgi:hypothetical protein
VKVWELAGSETRTACVPALPTAPAGMCKADSRTVVVVELDVVVGASVVVVVELDVVVVELVEVVVELVEDGEVVVLDPAVVGGVEPDGHDDVVSGTE